MLNKTNKNTSKKKKIGRPKSAIRTKLVGIRLPLKIAKWVQTEGNKPILVSFIESQLNKGKKSS